MTGKELGMECQGLLRQQKNVVFLGEAGCGKSEIAMNLACALARLGEKQVHFFDLDMTKPLFRSRDLARELEEKGVIVHYEEQFMDAPTVTGGVMRLLRDPACYVVLDVGGDAIGARSIGGYAPLLNAESTVVYYVVNSYRAWSLDIDHIDRVLGEVLAVSHIRLDNLRLLSNCNLGVHTTAADVLAGKKRACDMIEPYHPIDAHCVWDALLPRMPDGENWLGLHLFLTYPWERDSELNAMREEL